MLLAQHALAALAGSCLFFMAPAWLVVRRSIPDLRPLDGAGLALAAGILGITQIYSATAILTLRTVWPALALVAVGATGWVAVAAGGWLLRRRGRHERAMGEAKGRFSGHAAVAVVIGAVVSVAAAIGFPAALLVHPFCDYQLVSRTLGLSMGSAAGRYAGLYDSGHGALGFPSQVIPFETFFGAFGIRLFFALAHGSLFACTCLAARSQLGDRTPAARWCALASATVVTLLPATFGHMDVNLAAAATSAWLIALLVLPEPPPMLAGAAYGALWNVQHLSTLLLPPIVAHLSASRGFRSRQLVRFAAAAVLMTIPCHLRHFLVRGNPFSLEHFGYIDGDFAYRFLGVDFRAPTFLNWPLLAHVVRSFGNPLPNLALAPLHVLRSFGVLLASCAVLAIVRARRAPASIAFLVTYAALPVAAIALLENWTEVEKRNVPQLGYPAVAVLIALGAHQLARRERRAADFATLALAAGALAAAMHLVPGIDVPLDQREGDFWRSRAALGVLPAETPDILAVERQRLARLAWLPEHWPPAGPLPFDAPFEGYDAVSRRMARELASFSAAGHAATLVEQWGVAISDRVQPGAFDRGLGEPDVVYRASAADGLAVPVEIALGAPAAALRFPIGSAHEGNAPILMLDTPNQFQEARLPWLPDPVSLAWIPAPESDVELVVLWRSDPVSVRDPAAASAIQGVRIERAAGRRVVLLDVVAVEPARAYFYRETADGRALELAWLRL